MCPDIAVRLQINDQFFPARLLRDLVALIPEIAGGAAGIVPVSMHVPRGFACDIHLQNGIDLRRILLLILCLIFLAFCPAPGLTLSRFLCHRCRREAPQLHNSVLPDPELNVNSILANCNFPRHTISFLVCSLHLMISEIT